MSFCFQLSYLLIQHLNLFAVFLFALQEFLLQVLDDLLFSSQLVVFVIDYALKSIYRLLSCLGQFDGLLFVVVLLVFLVVDKSTGIVLELTSGELSLHQEIGS